MNEPRPPRPSPPAPPREMSGRELVEQLRDTLSRAGDLLGVLSSNLGEASRGFAARSDELEERLAAAETDMRELATQLVESEHQAERLMNLYVATYQLHAMLDPDQVGSTIAEIAFNLLGAQRFVLLLRRDEGGGCEIALREGVDAQTHPLFGQDVYAGGDALVDQTLADGQLRMGPAQGSEALAVVPLKMHNEIVGVIVILKLFDHKPALRPEDRDLLDLLSAHAASALFAARLFAIKDRKLRTLESLVKLARGE